MNKKLSPNMEMYLKTILCLGESGSPVRVKAIADSLGITMPSVSEALHNLKTRGLVLHPSYGEVRLSARGRRLAKGISERFDVLQRFLVDVLGVEEAVAEDEACEIEHVLGADTFERLNAYLEFLDDDAGDIRARFREYLDRALAARATDTAADTSNDR